MKKKKSKLEPFDSVTEKIHTKKLQEMSNLRSWERENSKTRKTVNLTLSKVVGIRKRQNRSQHNFNKSEDYLVQSNLPYMSGHWSSALNCQFKTLLPGFQNLTYCINLPVFT